MCKYILYEGILHQVCFLSRYLGLDVTKAMNPDGTLKEDNIVIEDQKALYSFNEKHPFPANGIRNNDDVVWK